MLDYATSWFHILDFNCINPTSHHGLMSFGLLNDSSFYVHHHVSIIPYYDLDDDGGSIVEPSFDIVPNPIDHSSLNAVDPTSCSLYASTASSDQI